MGGSHCCRWKRISSVMANEFSVPANQGTPSTPTNSALSVSLLPPIPPIFGGRRDGLVRRSGDDPMDVMRRAGLSDGRGRRSQFNGMWRVG
eukprot:6003808-Pyramimonas_sp.AAC.1